jgi:hypothetical protein
MAMAMLAAVLVPIVWMVSGTANQTAQSKAEAAAAGYAATVMNTLLDKLPFDHAVLASGTHESQDVTDPLLPGDTVIDGTSLRWSLQVHDFSSDAITFRHWRIRFTNIPECPPDDGVAPGDLPAFSATDHVQEVDSRTIFNLDAKKGRGPGGVAIPVLKELRLTIQWKTPRDDDFETLGGDERILRRSVTLLTRRARLRRQT